MQIMILATTYFVKLKVPIHTVHHGTLWYINNLSLWN